MVNRLKSSAARRTEQTRQKRAAIRRLNITGKKKTKKPEQSKTTPTI